VLHLGMVAAVLIYTLLVLHVDSTSAFSSTSVDVNGNALKCFTTCHVVYWIRSRDSRGSLQAILSKYTVRSASYSDVIVRADNAYEIILIREKVLSLPIFLIERTDFASLLDLLLRLP